MIAARKPGCIINITSVPRQSRTGQAYPATKAGLASLTRLMALEWGVWNPANAIAPGFIDAGMSNIF